MARLRSITEQHATWTFTDDNLLRAEGGAAVVDEGRTINLRCPHCSHNGAFHSVAGTKDVQFNKSGISRRRTDNLELGPIAVRFIIGLRVCPNLACRGLVTVLQMLRDQSKREVVWTSPPELIDFDASKIPVKIKEAMIEAVACHAAGAYRASAIMIRRALENLCEEKQAKGSNLKDRINKLGNHATISPALLEAADHLRIICNDAAHVEAKEYDQIGEEHARAAIDLAKEILKAVYQHDDLVSRLRSLSKPTD